MAVLGDFGGTGLYKSEFQRIFIPICLRVLQRHLHFYYLKNRASIIYRIFFFKRVCEVVFSFYKNILAIVIRTDHRRPMKPFFIEIHNFWAWADQSGK